MAKRTETVIQEWTDGRGAIHQINIPLTTFLMDYGFEAVVRCKDCVYWDTTEKVCVDMMTADEDGYCSWGERKEDGKEN